MDTETFFQKIFSFGNKFWGTNLCWNCSTWETNDHIMLRGAGRSQNVFLSNLDTVNLKIFEIFT